MKKIIFTFFLFVSFISVQAYDKLSVVERFTNCSCGPCATINNSWYNATTANLLANGSITHIIYNVDWPSPTDPMHVLNAVDNNQRRGYYGVNSVPWICVNGTTITTSQAALENAVTSGNSSYSPFNIQIIADRFSNDVVNVKVIITRDPSDVTVFQSTKLRIALTELTVDRTCLTCCNNGETLFHNVTRKMLPDGKGTIIQIPNPGESVEYEFSFIPSAEFLADVDMTALSAVAFIQDDVSKLVYQSAVEDVLFSNNVNAAFKVDENIGAVPFTLAFQNYSTATDSTTLISYSWDFDNDGTIDSQEPNPSFTYNTEGNYSVKLIVGDGNNQHTRILTNYINSITNDADILVVNGIDYSNATYIPEMAQFYSSSACIGNNQADVWDLFGDQGYDYLANSSFQKSHLYNRGIPTSVLNLYNKVIWIGNNFSGDLAFFDPAQVIEYVQSGRNFLLATRLGSNFFDTQLRDYCGIQGFTADMQVTDLVPLESGIVTMPSIGTNNLVHLVSLSSTSQAVLVFDDLTSNNYYAGFRLNKAGEGTFIYIAGRPYRFNSSISYSNYDYIINNWMISAPLPVELTSFSATALPGKVELNWTTASEINNSGFEVERSIDGKTFITAGFVKGNGTTTEPKTYSFTDVLQSGLNPKLFYRLKQVDFNGTFAYSNIVEINADIPTEFSLEQNYPNPFNPTTVISFSLPEKSDVSLKIFDVLGNEIATLVNEIKDAGRYDVQFNASKLSSGVYFYSIEAGAYNDLKKMILIK